MSAANQMKPLLIPHDPIPIVRYYAYFIGENPAPKAIDSAIDRAWARLEEAAHLRASLADAADEHGDGLREQYLRIDSVSGTPSVVMDAKFALSLTKPTRDALEEACFFVIQAPNRGNDDPLGLAIAQLAIDELLRSGTVLVHDWCASRALFREDYRLALDGGVMNQLSIFQDVNDADEVDISTRGLSKFGLPELRTSRDRFSNQTFFAVAAHLINRRRRASKFDPGVSILEVYPRVNVDRSDVELAFGQGVVCILPTASIALDEDGIIVNTELEEH